MANDQGQRSRASFPVADLSREWARASHQALTSTARLMEGVVDANRAFFASFGGPAPVHGNAPAAVPEMAYKEADWIVERSVDAYEDIGVGDSVSFTKQVSDDDVRGFAQVSGDTNRLHLDEGFARETRFGGRIVHGTLLAGLISAALARLPGLTIYLSQDLEFLAPVSVGETVTADCEIVEDLGGGRYRLVTSVTDEEGERIIDGEAVVLVDDLPDEAGDT